jgi:predicted DNA-binding transcriptional regulator YafY
VGQRSQSETVAALLKAFLDQRTWKQADLARLVGVQTATIRKQLEELRASGVPLESEKDHPHVFWSVPKSWYPGGVLFSGEQITELFRQLSRLPKSGGRDQLIETVRKFVPALPADRAPGAVVSPEATAREQQFLPIIEDAATQRVALRFRYYSASRGSEDTRHGSVHRVMPSPRASFLATCHRTGELKSFRVESVSDAKLDPNEPFRAADEKALEAHGRASLDGFHGSGAVTREAFFVSDPDARWVARNLLDAMQAEPVPGGIRVTLETSALPVLGRFVVGLGGSAKALTPALQGEVARLARGALASMGAAESGESGARRPG